MLVIAIIGLSTLTVIGTGYIVKSIKHWKKDANKNKNYKKSVIKNLVKDKRPLQSSYSQDSFDYLYLYDEN